MLDCWSNSPASKCTNIILCVCLKAWISASVFIILQNKNTVLRDIITCKRNPYKTKVITVRCNHSFLMKHSKNRLFSEQVIKKYSQSSLSTRKYNNHNITNTDEKTLWVDREWNGVTFTIFSSMLPQEKLFFHFHEGNGETLTWKIQLSLIEKLSQ